MERKALFYPGSGYDFTPFLWPTLREVSSFVYLDARPVFRLDASGALRYPLGLKLFEEGKAVCSRAFGLVFAEAPAVCLDGESYRAWRVQVGADSARRAIHLLFVDGVDVEAMGPELKRHVADTCDSVLARGFQLDKALPVADAAAFGWSKLYASGACTQEEQAYFAAAARECVYVPEDVSLDPYAVVGGAACATSAHASRSASAAPTPSAADAWAARVAASGNVGVAGIYVGTGTGTGTGARIVEAPPGTVGLPGGSTGCAIARRAGFLQTAQYGTAAWAPPAAGPSLGAPAAADPPRAAVSPTAAGLSRAAAAPTAAGPTRAAAAPTAAASPSEAAYLAALQQLVNEGWEPDARACAAAAKRGFLLVLQWAHAGGTPWDAATTSAAAAGGHEAVLEWAHSMGCPLGPDACAAAAKKGRLATLVWLRARGCPWDARTCHMAAANGHLGALKWARAHGCAWGAATCSVAAGRGRWKVLRWLHANGCEWDAGTTSAAAAGGHYALLRWLRAQGCPEPSPDSKSPCFEREVKAKEQMAAASEAPSLEEALRGPDVQALLAVVKRNAPALLAAFVRGASARPLIVQLKNDPPSLEFLLATIAPTKVKLGSDYAYFTEVSDVRTFDLYQRYGVETSDLYEESVTPEQWTHLLTIGYTHPRMRDGDADSADDGDPLLVSDSEGDSGVDPPPVAMPTATVPLRPADEAGPGPVLHLRTASTPRCRAASW